jgi:hypothetical protein
MQMAEARRVATDTRLWQVPAMALTAIAFLLASVLNPNASQQAIIVASSVGALVLSSCALQLRKHRFHEVTLSRWLSDTQRGLGLPEVNDVRRGGPFEDHFPRGSWIWDKVFKAAVWWEATIWILLVADVVLLFAATRNDNLF